MHAAVFVRDGSQTSHHLHPNEAVMNPPRLLGDDGKLPPVSIPPTRMSYSGADPTVVTLLPVDDDASCPAGEMPLIASSLPQRS
jgi:hypothetical protein